MKRRRSSKETGSETVKSQQDKIDAGVKSVQELPELKPLGDVEVNWKRTLSTGSTLLDLAISSGRTHYGGVPGGILIEIYGKSGSGKTSILSELCGAAQAKGGDISFQDPEARLDEEYAKTYGVTIPKDAYHQPDTVTEMFEKLEKWTTKKEEINVFAADSLAALSTNLELEKGDKMGMRRAKEFSEGLRKYARKINKRGDIIACSNQIRHGEYGDITPGGNAVEFYSSLRVQVNQVEKLFKEKKYKWKNDEGVDVEGKAVKRAYGIRSHCVVSKSSIDKPYRDVPIYIIFDYGIDDIRGNLQWLKDTLGLTKYKAVNKEYQRMDQAIDYIETNNYEESLRKEVVELWHQIEEKFRHKRKVKKR